MQATRHTLLIAVTDSTAAWKPASPSMKTAKRCWVFLPVLAVRKFAKYTWRARKARSYTAQILIAVRTYFLIPSSFFFFSPSRNHFHYVSQKRLSTFFFLSVAYPSSLSKCYHFTLSLLPWNKCIHLFLQQIRNKHSPTMSPALQFGFHFFRRDQKTTKVSFIWTNFGSLRVKASYLCQLPPFCYCQQEKIFQTVTLLLLLDTSLSTMNITFQIIIKDIKTKIQIKINKVQLNHNTVQFKAQHKNLQSKESLKYCLDYT